MTHDTAEAIMDELGDLLDAERGALLDGDLERISSLMTEKSALIDRLNALSPDDRPALGGLQDKVIRNQALLDGALDGIRNVAARVSALRQARRNLETYDESGRKRTIEGEVVRQIEKRA